MRSKFKIAALAAAASMAAASAASAGAYDFNYVTLDGPSGVETASGSFTTSDVEANGGYQILSVNGSANGSQIMGLSTYADADNIYFDTTPHFDFGGFSFATQAGPIYNLFSQAGYYVISSTVDSVGYPQSGSPVTSLTISAAPEPATWLMLLGAVALVGGCLRVAAARRTRELVATA